MKFKIGQKVRLKEGLVDGKRYGTLRFLEKTMKFEGELCISDLFGIDYYLANGCCYSEDMLEPVVDWDFKVGDKVIFNPADKDKLTGVFTVSEIDMDLGMPYIKLKEVKECMWFDPSRFLKVPLFKVGQIVTFKNIDNDRWPHSAYIEGESGIIASIDMHFYAPNKPGEDGNRYHVRSLKTGTCWHTTSASLELVPLIATLDDIKVTAADDPGLRGYLGVVVRDNSALAIAQAVDNVKGPQFKIGDRVLIRKDLVPGKKYEEWDYSPEDGMGGWEFAAAMAKYMGKVATITGYVADDPNYCHLDIDKGTYSWIVNALLPYTLGSDYDLDKQSFRQINKYFPTNKQQTKQNYENRLQEKGPVIAGRERQSGCAVRYPGEQIRVGISNLGYRKVTCKR